MGDHADDARDEEEDWNDMKMAHKSGLCKSFDYCPYCDPDFLPFFDFQRLYQDGENNR